MKHVMKTRLASAPKMPVTGRLSSASSKLSNRPRPMSVPRGTMRHASPSSGTPAPDEGEARFPKGAREMLKALACRDATYEYTDESSGRPSTLTKTQVATLAGISPTSGTFNTYLSSLRSNGLVETIDGELKASDNLFL